MQNKMYIYEYVIVLSPPIYTFKIYAQFHSHIQRPSFTYMKLKLQILIPIENAAAALMKIYARARGAFHTYYYDAIFLRNILSESIKFL